MGMLKKFFTGDPYRKQKMYEKMAMKEAKKKREIEAGVAAYKMHRFGNKTKLLKSEYQEIAKFRKSLVSPPPKKSFDNIINDFIPNPSKVGVVDIGFDSPKKSKKKDSYFDGLARF